MNEKTVFYLLAREDVPTEDRIYRNLTVVIRKPTDLEPVSKIFRFSIPKTWSEDTFNNIVIEWIHKLVDEEQSQE